MSIPLSVHPSRSLILLAQLIQGFPTVSCWPDTKHFNGVRLVSAWKKSTSPHLFKPVQTCSNLFKPVNTSCQSDCDDVRPSSNFSFSLHFSISKADIFQSYILSCWSCLHLAHLIEIFPTVYGWSSLGKSSASHLFKPVHPCTHLSEDVCSPRNFSLSFNFPFWKLLFFSLTSYPADVAYFSSPNKEQCVWLV